jgi:acetoacetyl-CoA reductase
MTLAREVASKVITVKTVSPGYIVTRMTTAIPGDLRHQIVASIPMRRMGNPDDVAAAKPFWRAGTRATSWAPICP